MKLKSKSPLFIGVIHITLVAALGVPVLAHGDAGHGYQDGMGMYFDPGTITTLGGTLQRDFGDWQVRGHGNHTGGGMAFELAADNGKQYDLMVAPEWFLDEAGVSLQAGERITVTGSVLEGYDQGRHGHGQGQGGPGHHDDDGSELYLIATTLTADGQTLALRDEDGYPLWRGGPGWAGHQWFDPDTVTTMAGTLSDLLGMWSSWGHGNHTGNGMHYLFDSGTGETYYLMLGPWWFIEGQGVEPRAGASVEIRGSVVDSYWSGYEDHRFLIATEVTIDGTTAQLRDEWGYPLWHGTGWHYSSPAWGSGDSGRMHGTVVRVRRRSHGSFLDEGYELLISSGGERHLVFVAPDWFVRPLGLELRKGDEITVVGVSSGSPRRTDWVTRYLVADGKRWKFRSRKGSPLWVAGAR